MSEPMRSNIGDEGVITLSRPWLGIGWILRCMDFDNASLDALGFIK